MPVINISSLPQTKGKIIYDEPMSGHTSFKIGGPADVFAMPADVSELQALVKWARSNRIPFFILGAGSNLLVADDGIRGLVIHLDAGFSSARVSGTKITAGAAMRLPALVRKALGAGLAGLEGLAGIPGTVGGAVYMNAGTPAGCIGDTLESIKALDPRGDVQEVSARDLGLRYRESGIGRQGLIVTEATFNLRPENQEMLTEIISSLRSKRKTSQPTGVGTAGSVFKNPPNDFAGRILDEAGAKGMQVGGARVSRKHANFIENTGNATAEDVSMLITALQELAQEKAGVHLEPEIQFVGEWEF